MATSFQDRLAPPPRGDTFSLIAILVAVVGVIAGFVGVGEGMKCLQVLTWPTVKVESASGYVQALRSNKGNLVYEPSVRIPFSVDGRTYECTRIHPVSMRFSDSASAEAELSFARDSTIHYNPSDPSDSCMTARPNDRSLYCLLAGIGGLAIAVYAFRRQRRRQARAEAPPAAGRP